MAKIIPLPLKKDDLLNQKKEVEQLNQKIRELLKNQDKAKKAAELIKNWLKK